MKRSNTECYLQDAFIVKQELPVLSLVTDLIATRIDQFHDGEIRWDCHLMFRQTFVLGGYWYLLVGRGQHHISLFPQYQTQCLAQSRCSNTLDGWMHGWMEGKEGQTDGWQDGCMVGWMDRRKKEKEQNKSPL